MPKTLKTLTLEQSLNNFKNLEEKIYKCSKCGLCQSACPMYKETGNDCQTARGIFIMLYGFLQGRIEFSPIITEYLEKCINCPKSQICKDFCPSGIDMHEIFTSAMDYFKNK